MSDQNMTKVMDRIKKLLALSTSPNENEAAAAAEKAQALLAEYNLSMSDVSDKESGDESIVMEEGGRTAALPWRRPLGQAIANMYFCRYIYTTIPFTETKDTHGNIKRTKQAVDIHQFIGAKHNVAVAKIMFSYLTEAIDRLAKAGALTVPEKERSPYRTTFRGACANRVGVRIMKRIEAAKRGQVVTEGGTNLPALLDLYQSWNDRNQAFMEEAFPKLKTVAVRNAMLHGKGYADGREAGDKIGLDQQVGSGKQQRIGR